MDNEIIANSEAVKEAVEVAADTATEGLANLDAETTKFVIGVGVGVLATVVVAKCVIPGIKRKFQGFGKPKKVKAQLVKEDEPMEEQETETPNAEEQDDEESGEENEKK